MPEVDRALAQGREVAEAGEQVAEPVGDSVGPGGAEGGYLVEDQAGVGDVMARSAFTARLPEILART